MRLQTLKIDTKSPILLQRETFLDRFGANYNEGIETFTARLLEGNRNSIPIKTYPDGKKIDVFKTPTYEGGKTIFTAVDTAGNTKVDTLDIKFTGKIAARIAGAQLKVINKENNGGYRVGQEVVVEVQTPVNITKPEPIRIFADSVQVGSIKYPEEITIDSTATELRFNFPKLETSQRQLTLALDSTAIVPQSESPLSFRNIPITIAENIGTGSIKGSVATSHTSYSIQLLDEKYKKVSEVRNQPVYNFRDLTPGNYIIRVLIDENKNGIWEAGDPKMEREPEPVYVHPEVQAVRANWEIADVNLEF